jgi:hypothetical protein
MYKYKYGMIATRSQKVIRNLMAEEKRGNHGNRHNHGSIQKIATEKVKNTTKYSNMKKNNNGEVLCIIALKKMKKMYWLRFNNLEQLAIEVGTPKCNNNGSMEDVVIKKYIRTKTKELKLLIISFSRILQKLYPSMRSVKVLRQHFNLIHLSFGIKINPDIGLMLDFHISIYFEQLKTHFEHEEIVIKAIKNLNKWQFH